MNRSRLILLVLVVGGSLAVPLLPLESPQAIVAAPLEPPSPGLPLGTDQFGRDLALRLAWAAHIAVRNALLALALILFGVGGLAFAFALSPDPLRSAISQSILILLTVPPLLLAIALLVTAPSSAVIAVALGLLPVVARYVNALVVAELVASYTRAARLSGASRLRVTLEHILPNVSPRIASFSVVIVVWAILSLTSLEFLGLVGSPSDVSIGRMIDEGRQVMTQTPRPVLAPTLLLLGLALLGGTRYNWHLKRNR